MTVIETIGDGTLIIGNGSSATVARNGRLYDVFVRHVGGKTVFHKGLEITKMLVDGVEVDWRG